MRILFSMAYPGYLRYFDSTIRGLLDRGHSVELVFESVGKQEEGLLALDEHPRLDVGGRFPKRRDRWAEVANQERRLTDYVRYLDPRFADAQYLRSRAGAGLPKAFSLLKRVRSLPKPIVQIALRFLVGLEQVIPRGPAIDDFVRQREPDAVVVTPLVTIAARSADLVASARAAGIPTAVAVASWDHLTTKGLMRIIPDRVYLWNAKQASEAVELHRVPHERFVITGAQPFDRWFDRRPGRERAAFCRRVGLPDGKPYVLFVGSTASISEPDSEKRFVRRWAQSLRESANAEVRNLAVLVRPHPYNSTHWNKADLADIPNASVFPYGPANPVDEDDRTDYFDSIYHSEAVVGINTSAMIESAIIGRPVLSVMPPEFADTQAGTIHFRYLLPENGGFLRVSREFAEHNEQLASLLSSREQVASQLDGFVRSFIRPCGRESRATDLLVDSIEQLEHVKPAGPTVNRVLRGALRLVLFGWLFVARLADNSSRRQLFGIKLRKLGSDSLGRIRRARPRGGGSCSAIDMGNGRPGGLRPSPGDIERKSNGRRTSRESERLDAGDRGQEHATGQSSRASRADERGA
jgi:hypothetical protein